ncbi:MAG: type II toxin-antitoxin system CcdA family antitoxin [Pseudomonadota bacterium]
MGRKATNLSLDEHLLQEAKALGVNISRAAESGLELAVAEKRAEQWKRENKGALESSNEWVERNGLPLNKFRPF